MSMHRYSYLLLIVILLSTGFSISKPEIKINWLSVEEATALAADDPRPIVIDLYTDWCYWCKVMDKKTYTDDKVIRYINEHFYAVKMDAESRKDVEWQNKEFGYNPVRKVNDFSLYVTNGQLSFPSTVIFPSLKDGPAAIPGYMSPGEIEPILKYFGEGVYKNQTFQEYMKTFKGEWK